MAAGGGAGERMGSRQCATCLGAREVLAYVTPPGSGTQAVFVPCPACGKAAAKPARKPTLSE